MSLLDSTFDDLSNMAVLVSSTNPMMPSAQMTATTTNVNNLFDSNHTDSVNGLFSNETLDGRSSPDLWPERIPGVTEFMSQNNSPLRLNTTPRIDDTETPDREEGVKEWNTEFDQEDMNMLQGFGSLTTSNLLEKVKELQDLAYQLGLEESREMTRGKFLEVLARQELHEPSSGGLTPLSSPISSIRRDLR